MAENTYGQNLALLASRVEIIELAAGDLARVAVAPAYQGRVMTSALAGSEGASFGWLNAEFIASGGPDETFNNYGGEDRFWLGPEAGQFGLWFANGEPFDLDHWKTPAGFNDGAFDVVAGSAASIEMTRRFEVANYSGTGFTCGVNRKINLIDASRAGELLGQSVDGLDMVAFESVNVLTNAGEAPWTRDTGLLSVWILGQYKPLPRGKVIVPFTPGSDAALGPAATTDYFGPLPAERCTVADDHVLFTCDGGYRSKIGVSPRRARDVVASYDADAGVLTIVQFNLPAGTEQLPYVNSLWQVQDEPFAGDVINSYNDGEAQPGAGQLGPFYEIETSSPAAQLSPSESVTHVHRTMHFAGDGGKLADLARAVLGVDIGRIAF